MSSDNRLYFGAVPGDKLIYVNVSTEKITAEISNNITLTLRSILEEFKKRYIFAISLSGSAIPYLFLKK